MSKDKEPPERPVKLKVRPIIVTNVNLKPERHGKDFVERVDVSIECLLQRDEITQFLKTVSGETPLDLLWDSDGNPELVELDGSFPLSLKIVGTAKIGYARDTAKEFSTATLKKISLEPLLDHKATMRAQVRVDPENHVNMLSKIQIEHAAKFGFDGIVDEKPDAGGDDEQGELPV
jgi:hypothetical protein